MNTPRLASIVIDNYNYARFLGDAIDSALAQTYSKTEVIVVDDGSTDYSRSVIEHYGDRVIPVFKENGGQGSAFNAGFDASRGDVIVFLDSDDLLLPSALERAMPFFEDPGVVKVHWPLWLVDEGARHTGRMYPGPNLADGDLRELVFNFGPTNHLSAPGCGNAWSRSLLERLFPIPEALYVNGCDTYLFEAAPFYGVLRTVPEPQTLYRQHQASDHTAFAPEVKVERELRFYDHYAPLLAEYCRSIGISVDLEVWRSHSWWHRHHRAIHDIATLPAPQRPIAVADDGTWETGPIAGRPRVPFPALNGDYAGIPLDDETAIAEVERVRGQGVAFLVFGWPTFWWLQYFTAFDSYLRTTYHCRLTNERVIVFDLREVA
jgi:glycosyltransferase involved in cell wall biosynthesis